MTAIRVPLPPVARSRYPGEYLALLARDFLAMIQRIATHGDLVQIRIAVQRVVLVNHPKDIQQVLVAEQRAFIKGRGGEVLRDGLLGEGLLTSEAPVHLRQRRLMQPAFHRERIAAYATVMARDTQRLADQWTDGATVDVHEAMMHLARDIAGETLFGLQVGEDPGGIEEALDLWQKMAGISFLPFGVVLERLPLPLVLRAKAARTRLNNWLAGLIHERRADGIDRGDLLSMLLEARDPEDDGRGMTDRQIRDEMVTLLLAGHETTAVALTWTWYLLSQHPEVEAKLHAEVAAVLGDRPPTIADVPALAYTRMVFAEAIRLYPPAWSFDRQAVRNVQIGDYLIPQGSLVVVSPYLVHHDPRWYPDPERFDPERWRPEAAVERPKFSYFPFGGGTRMCIGEQFAWMEGILVLATLAQRWRLRHVPGHVVALDPLVTLRPKSGMPMRLERRS
jgi:cytochrome P450